DSSASRRSPAAYAGSTTTQSPVWRSPIRYAKLRICVATMSPAAKSRPDSSWRKYRRSVDKSDTPTAYDPSDRPGISARSSWPSRGCGGRRRSGCAAGDVDRLSCRGLGIVLCMLKTVEIEIDDDLVQEAIRRYHVADAREAVHLALRTLLE